jgi:uncharacterized protein YdhG (YjbR/CyaY superfamily)
MEKSDKNPPIKTVNDYISLFPEDKQRAMEHLRQLIKTIIPQAEECISYQIPMYKYHGMLVGFAAYAHHCSFTAANAHTLETFRADLKGFKFSPSTVQFTPENPLPDALIERIVRAKIKENEEKAGISIG